MTTLFTRLPFSVPDNGLPIVPASDIRQLSPFYEYGAYGIWDFKNNVSSLTDYMNGEVFTPQSTDPTYSSTHITIPSATGKSMLSGVTDGESALTICGVFRTSNATALQIMFGNITSTLGMAMYPEAGSLKLTVRGFTPGTTNCGAIAVDTWVFIAVSATLAGTGLGVTYKVGSSPAVQVPCTGTYSKANTGIAIGSSGYTYGGGAGLGSIGCAETVLFKRHLSTDELENVYQRCKERMQVKGISI